MTPAPAGRECLIEVGGRPLLVDADVVRQVIEIGPVTRLPRAPRALRGLIAHRNAVLPLVDLAALLDPARAAARGRRGLIVQLGSERVALEVDDVSALRAADGAPLAPLPGDLPAPLRRCALGVRPDGERARIVLDPGALAAALRRGLAADAPPRPPAAPAAPAASPDL